MEGKDEVTKWCEFHEYDFRKYNGSQRIDKMARNLVDFEAGKTILETALNIVRKSNTNQISIFDAL
jgi:DNA (cytosine-5)-methyltransferase 1